MAKVATDFEKIINEGRERKKNEALADRIFSKNRRRSAPSKLKSAPGQSLASRVGVKKVATAKDRMRLVEANMYSSELPPSAPARPSPHLAMSTENGHTICITPSQAT
ncbi:uncharacterized protein LW94_10732 [Fusarium fujikuroi]|nr:uncharacterized protein LW94_10732 [Fusarium fujikuroi]